MLWLVGWWKRAFSTRHVDLLWWGTKTSKIKDFESLV